MFILLDYVEIKNINFGIFSYDEKLRIFTLLSTDPKVSLTQKLEINLGGMVWRTMFLPPLIDKSPKTDENGTALDPNNTLEDVFYFAVACGRNGIQVLKIDRQNWTYETALVCNEHKNSLGYGLDVMARKDMGDYLFATCYFDNQMLHVWRSDLQNEIGPQR